MHRLCQLYGKTVRWFLTLSEQDVEHGSEGDDLAWRIYQRVSAATQEHQAILERVVDQTLGELEAGGSEHSGSD